MKNKQENLINVEKIVSIDELLRKRLHTNILLSRWKRKMQSAQKKIQKYRATKKQFSQEIASAR